jgi:pimeloyl-ACP methyl ester carboxylesterase
VNTVELSAGPITYIDTGGSGPTILFLHGLLMDASLWDEVIDDLRRDYRCVAPTLPLGAHQRPMVSSADLSLPGVARLVTEFMDSIDLADVTLVGNDTGGAIVQLVVAQGATRRVSRIGLVSCEAFDNVPPGLTGKTVVAAGKLPPPLFGLFMQQMRVRPLRRLPIAFGWLTKKGDRATARWMKPLLNSSEIRRDAMKVLRAIGRDRKVLIAAAEQLPKFDGRSIVIWAKDDRVMPPEHGRRLASLLTTSEHVEIADSYTLIPLDQPAELAKTLRNFLTSPPTDRSV